MIESGINVHGAYGEILIDDLPEDVAHTNLVWEAMGEPMRIIVFAWYVLRLDKSQICGQLSIKYSSLNHYLEKSEEFYEAFS